MSDSVDHECLNEVMFIAHGGSSPRTVSRAWANSCLSFFDTHSLSQLTLPRKNLRINFYANKVCFTTVRYRKLLICRFYALMYRNRMGATSKNPRCRTLPCEFLGMRDSRRVLGSMSCARCMSWAGFTGSKARIGLTSFSQLYIKDDHR